MTRDSIATSPARCLIVWAAASAALAALALALSPGLVLVATGGSAPPRFDDALVRVCEAALLGCAAWLWTVTTVVVLDAARGRARARRAIPAGLRRAVLTACGAALATAVAVPAQAAPSPSVSTSDRAGGASAVRGLPLPDRATAAGHVAHLVAVRSAARPQRQPQGRGDDADGVVTVRVGDTLWGLAAARLPSTAPDAQISRRWQQIYRVNRAEIGPDPDLIHPDQQLRLPRP